MSSCYDLLRSAVGATQLTILHANAEKGAVSLHAQVVPSEGQEVVGLDGGSLGHLTLGELCEESLCLGESLRIDGGGLGASGLGHRSQHLSEGGLDEERTALGPLDVCRLDEHLVGDLLHEGLAEDGDEDEQGILGLEVHEDVGVHQRVRVLRLDPHGVLGCAGVEPARQGCHC